MRLMLLFFLLMANGMGFTQSKHSIAIECNELTKVEKDEVVNLSSNTFNARQSCSPTLSTGLINGSPICAGAIVNVPYNFTDCVDAGNIFNVELSDALGSFATPTVIGTLASTTSGTISAVIPSNISTVGNAYRIRVVASSPATIGSDNGTDLTIIPKPNAGFNVNAAAQCISNNNFIFSNNSTGSISGFNWILGDGNTSISNNASNVYTAAGNYNVKLVVTGTNGCKDSVTKTVLVSSIPAANFSIAKTSLCQGENFIFTNNSTIAVGSMFYSWSFGDGNFASSINANYAYTSSGNFDVKLIAQSNGGCIDSVTKTITVMPKEAALFSVNTLSQCSGESFVFTNNTSGNTTSLWSFGDGITSTLPSPAKTYSNSGNYNVKLIVTNTNGCKDSIQKTVTVLSKPNVSFNITGNTSCSNNSTFSFVNTSSGTGNTYLWRFGDGNTSSLFNATNTYNLEGTYNVQLVATGSNGCKDSISKLITFSSNAIASFTINNATQCIGTNNFIFTNTSSGNVVNSNWSFGDGITSTLPSPAKTYSSAGTYAVKLVVTNSNGCMDSVTKNVVVSAAPIVGFTTSGVVNCTNNLTVQNNNTSTNAASYFWTFGDGSNSTAVNPSHTYAVAGTYTIKLVATNFNGCSDSISNTITFIPNPIAAFSVNAAVQCLSGNSFVLNNTSLNSSNYLWSFGDGTISTSASPIKTYLTNGNYIIKLVVTNSNGCKDSVTNAVAVLRSPKALFNASYQACNSLSVQFTQLDTTATKFSVWYFGDGSVANDIFKPSHLYSSFGSYTVKYYTYDATSNCVDSATKIITLSSNPIASIYNSTSNKQCLNGNSFNFSSNSLQATSYNWTFGDGSTSTLANPPVKTYISSGIYTVKLTVTNNSGCTNTATIIDTVLPSPKANFNVIYQTCNRINVRFIQIDSNNTKYSAWDFGDGSGASDVYNTTHSYASINSFNVKYYAYDTSFFCVDSASKIISFSNIPAAGIGYPYSSKQCLNGNSFAHTNTSIGATNYLWDFGDGSTSTAATPAAKKFNAPGIYTVKLTATNANGCSSTTSVLDTVLPSPKAAFTASYQVCNNLNVQFTQINTAATQWSYLNFGDGKDTADKFSVSHLYAANGSYTVKYYAYDSNFYCSDSAVKVITLNPKPTAGITYLSSMNLVQCSNNNSFTFFDASSNAVSYQWNFGDGATSTVANPATHSYNAAGTYIVKQVVTGINGCKDSTTINVKVVPSPKAAFIANYNACNNLTVQFAQTNTSNTSLSTWDFGDGNSTVDVFNTTHTYSSVGSYTVTYYVFDTTIIYCEDSASKTITFSNNPTAAFTINNATQCLNGNAFSFNNTSLNGVSYLWYFGDGSFSTQQSPSLKTYSSAGTYTVKLIVTNANGCKDSVSHTVTVTQSPKASFTASFNACNNLTVQFTQTNFANTTYSAWDFGDGTGTSDVFSTLHTYTTTGTYIVKYYAYDASFNCVDSSVKTITLSPKPTADFTFNSLPQCVNSNSISIVNTSLNATSYYWTFGDGSFSFATNPLVTYTSVGTYTIKLIATNSNGCKDSTTRTINILSKPAPAFNIIGNTLCSSNLSISLDNTTTGVGNTYLWNFGDGDTSTAASVTKVYTAYGTYNIKLIVTNAAGCKDSLTKQVILTAKPIAAFSFISNNQCVNPTFSLSNNSSNFTSSTWNFGDGSSSTQNSPTHTYTNTGVFTIKLIVTNASGCKDSATSTITVNAKPTASFSVVGITNCTINRTVSITNNSVGAATYFYDFGDGTTSSLQNPTKTYSTAGTYTIKQVVTNSNGCKDSATQSITFSNSPSASFSVNNNSQCVSSNSFVFTNNSSNTINSFWSFGDATVSTQTSPIHIYTNAGVYTVKLVVTNSNGCKDSTSTSVTVLAKPTSSFSFTGATGCTVNKTVSIVNAATNATTYFYDFGDGTNSSLPNPTKTYSTTGTFVIKQIVTNANGCKDSSTQTITFSNIVTAAFVATANTTCTNANNVVIVNNSTNATIYNWTFGDGSTSTATNPVKTYTTSGTYTIKLVVSNAGGCKDSATQTITVVAKPIASFTIPNFNNCSNNNTFSFNNASVNAVSYVWNFGDGTTSNIASPSHTYSTTGTYNIKLIVTGANGCLDSMIRTISFIAKPVASFSTIVSTSCNNSFTFNNTSVSNATSANYMWTFGDASFSILQSPVKAYTNAGIYIVTLVVTNSNGCRDTTSQTVTVSPKPIASFIIPNFNSCNNSNNITVQSTSTNVASINWNFGDGTTASGANVAKTYTSAGTYTITMIVANANGCADSVSKTITLSSKPIASFTTNILSQCLNSNVFVFTNNSTISNGSLQYNWLFGDGTNSSVANPTKVYAAAGNYIVKLIATNSNTSCSDTATTTVTVLGKPITQFTVATSLCTNTKTISFNNTSIGAASTLWNFGDGNTSTGFNSTNTYLNYGSYTVSLITKNASGCSDTLSRIINIAALPTAAFSTNSSTQCFTGNSFNFTNTSANATNYTWSFGDGVVTTTISPTHSYTNAGTYVARLIATNINGCADSATTNIIVNASPTANFSYSGTTNCTTNLTLAFTNASSNATTYSWNFGDGVNINISSPNHTYSTAGTYTITLTAYHSNGCSDLTTQTVTFTTKPTAAFTVVGGSQCITNNSYSFTNNSTNATDYTWSFGDGITSTSNSPTHSYTNAGTFTVTLVASNGNSCTASSSTTVTVVAKPLAAFNLNNFNACASNNTVSTTNTSTGATNYTWDYGNGVLSNQTNPTITYSTAGTYTITLTASNASGCSDSTSKTITLFDKPTSSFNLVSSASQCVGSNSFSFINNSSNASTYLWNFGDGTTSSVNTPTHTYTGSGTFTVSLTVTSVNGCSSSSSSVVTLFAKPTASFNLSNYNSCLNNKTIYPLNTSTNASSYLWDFGDGILTADANPTHTYTNAGSYIVTLIASNNNGCVDTIKKTITVINKPISSFAIGGNTSQCLSNNTFTFVNYSTNAATYNWDFGDGSNSTNTNTSHTYSSAGTYTITLTVTSASGCSVASAQTITVYNKPNAAFIVDNAIQCFNGNLFNFTNTSTNITSVNYVWNFGDSNYTTQTNTVKTYTKPGVYKVVLTATNANGCVDSAFKTVTVNNSLVSAFAANTAAVAQCTNATIAFTNKTVGTATSYLWRLGDGATSTLTNPSRTYTSAGAYVITLISYSGNCVDSSSQTLIIGDKPTANFTATSANSCSSVYDFVSTSTGNIISYAWKFADSTVYSNSTLSYGFVKSGSQTVKLVISSAPGCNDSISKTVNVLPKPTVSYTQNAVIGCINDNNFTFTSTTTAGSLAVSNAWSFGDGTNATGNYVSKSYTSAGTYNVKLVSTIVATGCKDSITQAVQVYPKPTGIISGSIAICKGTSAILRFNFTGKPPFSASYTDGTSNFSINNIADSFYNLTVVPNVTTTYRLISVKDAICTAAEADLNTNATVTIHTLTYTKQLENVITCLGKNVIFTSTAFSNTSFTYQWFKNGIAIPGATKDTLLLTNVTTLDNGFYKLAAVLNCGSFNSNTATLRVDPLPPPPAYISNYTYCQFDTAQPLKATGTVVKWYDNAVNGLGSTIAPTPSTKLSGTYQYWVTNTTLPTCETPRFLVTTVVLPAPTITAKVVGPTTLIPIQTVTLSATASTNAVGVRWYRNNLYIGLTPNNKVVVDYTKPGTYYAEAITADGCKARTDSIVIKANAGDPAGLNVNNLLIYPNPTRSYINMYFNNPVNENATIRVVSMLGQVLKQMPYRYTAASQIVKMDVTGLHPEMYVVEIVNRLGTTLARNLFVKVD